MVDTAAPPAHQYSLTLCTVGTWDVVNLATAVMLQSIAATAAASTAATVFGTSHSHEAAGHG